MAITPIASSGLVARTDYAAPNFTFPTRPPNGSLLIITGSLFDGTNDSTINISDSDAVAGSWTTLLQGSLLGTGGRQTFIAYRENITGTGALTGR